MRLAVLESRIWGNGFESPQIRPISNNKYIFGVKTSSSNGQVPVAGVGGHNNVAKAVGHFFKPHLYLVEKFLFVIFRKIQLRVRVVMIKDVFDPQEFKGQGNQKNVVGRIAALNYMKATPEKYPPRVEKFPKQRAAVFIHIAEGAIPFFGHRVTVNMNPFEPLVSLRVSLASRTQDSYIETIPAE